MTDILNRLRSSDPDFDDCEDAAVEIDRLRAERDHLRAELAESRAKHMDDLLALTATEKERRELQAELTEARKPDCRQCSYHYACAKLERYPCDNGEDFVLHILRGPVRLYEKEGKV